MVCGRSTFWRAEGWELTPTFHGFVRPLLLGVEKTSRCLLGSGSITLSKTS